MKALILNECFSDNLGDQAIGKAMLEFVTSKGYDAKLVYLSNPTQVNLPSYEYNMAISRGNKNSNVVKSVLSILIYLYRYRSKIIQLIKSTSPKIVVIGGGQLFNASKSNEINGFAITIFWWTHLLKRLSPSTKIYAVAVGMANGHNRLERYLYRKSLERLDKVWVRDIFSQNEMKLTYEKPSTVIPDIAFYNPSGVLSSGNKKYMLLLGVANYDEVYLRYNAYAPRESYYSDVIKFSGLLDCLDNTALFYTTRRDVSECFAFQKYIKDNFNVILPVIETNDIDSLILVMKESEIVSSGRMHGLILAMKYGCKVRPFPISNKLKAFSKEYVRDANVMKYSNLLVQNIEL